MRELRVPKRRVEVELTFTGGERRTVAVFLSEQAPEHAGPERVSDVLTRREPFFPAIDPTTGETNLVARAAVALARLARADEPGDADELTIPTEHEVEIHLRDGQQVGGTLAYVLPPERSRLVDFLNVAPPFFRLLVGGDLLLLVSRDQVARVTALSR